MLIARVCQVLYVGARGLGHEAQQLTPSGRIWLRIKNMKEPIVTTDCQCFKIDGRPVSSIGGITSGVAIIFLGDDLRVRVHNVPQYRTVVRRRCGATIAPRTPLAFLGCLVTY